MPRTGAVFGASSKPVLEIKYVFCQSSYLTSVMVPDYKNHSLKKAKRQISRNVPAFDHVLTLLARSEEYPVYTLLDAC